MWACGGLSVFDAAIIVAWTALNIIYVWQRVAFIVPLFRGTQAKLQFCCFKVYMSQCSSCCCQCKSIAVLCLAYASKHCRPVYGVCFQALPSCVSHTLSADVVSFFSPVYVLFASQ